MRFSIMLSIGSGGALILSCIFGFIIFPEIIETKIKGMTALIPENDIRGMFVKVPFGLDFKVFIFNVTNPMDVQKGEAPKLQEIGPFCYSEWKEKINVTDNENEDTMMYNSKDTFFKKKGPGCLTGEEYVTMLHPLIVGMVNTVTIQKPGALNLINKAIMSIYRNPQSIYLTAKVNDILFDGVIIDCDVKDFAGKAVCSQLKTEAPDLKHVSENELAFSLIGPKNGTPGKLFKVYRGKKVNRNLGLIIEYDGSKQMNTWPTDECNEFQGTDGTIFPPLMKKEEGLVSFAPDLCRSLGAVYDKEAKYDGIPVWSYTATLGDMSKNADEKCYCPTPETCLKKGMMDLYKCVGVPLYVSLPHFYESDASYLKGVRGLTPNISKHGIQILFESTTGGPVSARKRLQFNMPIAPNPKLPLFKDLPTIVHPMFWVEEGVELNNTFTKPIKDLFKIMKIVNISKWFIIIFSLGGLGAAGFLFFKQTGTADITPVHKVKPVDMNNALSGISRVNGFETEVKHTMSDNGMNKF